MDCLSTLWLIEGLIIVFLFALAPFLANRIEALSVRVAAITASLLLVFVISAIRPVKINETHYRKPSRVTERTELVTLELQKANGEIAIRVQQEDTWFHYKFLLVGSMLAAFSGVFTFGKQAGQLRLAEVATSPTTCTLLGLACIIALSIDIHLRNNIIVILQLALWIAGYAEPALMPDSATGFVPWEQFLRTEYEGMHADDLYGFLFFPHLHFLTWAVYATYLCCFQAVTVAASRQSTESYPRALLGGGFIAVHLAFAAFAWVGHFVPGAFLTDVLPLWHCWTTGAPAALPYVLLAVLLFAVNSPFLMAMWRRP